MVDCGRSFSDLAFYPERKEGTNIALPHGHKNVCLIKEG